MPDALTTPAEPRTPRWPYIPAETTKGVARSNYTAPWRSFERAISTPERILDTVVARVYEASHADVIDNPFYSTERFVARVEGYLRAPGFELVAAYEDGIPIGLAFGYALPANARWWDGLTTPVDEGFTDETGTRTFALNELMVVPEWQGKGVAHTLHDDLLRGRTEERATLLVREDNTSAQQAYTRWGWRKVGKLRPYPDAPHFDAMILPLNG